MSVMSGEWCSHAGCLPLIEARSQSERTADLPARSRSHCSSCTPASCYFFHSLHIFVKDRTRRFMPFHLLFCFTSQSPPPSVRFVSDSFILLPWYSIIHKSNLEKINKNNSNVGSSNLTTLELFINATCCYDEGVHPDHLFTNLLDTIVCTCTKLISWSKGKQLSEEPPGLLYLWWQECPEV